MKKNQYFHPCLTALLYTVKKTTKETFRKSFSDINLPRMEMQPGKTNGIIPFRGKKREETNHKSWSKALFSGESTTLVSKRSLSQDFVNNLFVSKSRAREKKASK